MNNIKIAFFDIDGTLIAMDRDTMSEQMEDTLLQLQKNGIILCIATGRPPRSVPQFPRVKFDAYLTFNASYCFTADTVIFKNPIPTEDVNKIISNAKAIQRPVVLANVERNGANGRDRDIVDYFEISNQTVDVVDDFERLADEEIYQIMLGGTKKEYASILQGVTGAEITAWWPRAMDIIPYNGGKGLGVRKILEYYHLSKDEAIAFGDGTNDIEMLQAVGCGVAMGNASDDVKAVATDICPRVDEEGITQYCRKHHLV